MKKGQGTAALLYILGGVVMALAIYYGVSSVAQVKQEGTEAGLLLLESTIKTDIGRISSQYGSNRSINYNLGSDFTRICFADTTKKNLIKQDVSVPLIINDSVSAGSSNNVFLLGPKTEAFYGGEIRVCLKNVSCFNASRGVANVRMFGGGGFAMFDPCGPPVFSIPQVVNWTVAKEIKTEIYGFWSS